MQLYTVITLCYLISHLESGDTANVQGVAVNNTLTLAYLVSWTEGLTIGQQVGSAIILGIDEVYRRGLLPGYHIEWILGDDHCDSRHGTQVMVDLWFSVSDLDAVLTPSCSSVCRPVSLLAAAWGIPSVSWGCGSSSLSDKNTFPTFTRVDGTWEARVGTIQAMCHMFGWNKIGILSTLEGIYRAASQLLKSEMEEHDKKVVYRVTDSTYQGENIDIESLQKMRNILVSMKELVQIFVLLTYPKDIRSILIVAHDEGMLNGDYVFFSGNEDVTDILTTPQTYRPDMDGVIYNGLLARVKVEASGPRYDQFRQDVIDTFQDPRFDHLPHLPPDAELDDVNEHAGRCII